MKYCARCGNRLEDDARFCANCGAKCQPVDSPTVATGSATSAPKKELTATQKHQEKYGFLKDKISCGLMHVACIQEDGTVIAVGNNAYTQCNVYIWRDIIKIKCDAARTVGLRKDGTVLSTYDKFMHERGASWVGGTQFVDIVDIDCGLLHNVGLKRNGTVVAFGVNDCGQCDVAGWKNVKKIYAGMNHTIALCNDGSLLYCGESDNGAINLEGMSDVKELYCGPNDTVIVTKDGKVYRTDAGSAMPVRLTISGDDIVDVSFEEEYYLILQRDGTVLYFGSNKNDQDQVGSWRDILGVSCTQKSAAGFSKTYLYNTDKPFREIDFMNVVGYFGNNYLSVWVNAEGVASVTYTKSGKLEVEEFQIFKAEGKASSGKQGVPPKVNTAGMSNGSSHSHGTSGIGSTGKPEPGKESRYQQLLQMANHETDVRKLEDLVYAFHVLGDYKDSKKMAMYCHQRAIEERERNSKKVAGTTKRKKGSKGFRIFAVCILIIACLIGAWVLFSEGAYNDAVALMDAGEYYEAAVTFYSIRHYKDAKAQSFAIWDQIAKRESLAAGDNHTVGLKTDGTVVAVGSNYSGQCNVNGWTDIVAVSAGPNHTVGLKADGTVVAVGDNWYGQCKVGSWTDIVAVCAGGCITVGLKADGTVVAVGGNEFDRIEGRWTDIVAISVEFDHIVGLKADGTVVAECSHLWRKCNVDGWNDIVAISVGTDHIVGLKSNGNVVATGSNGYGQCEVYVWRKMLAISAGRDHTLGMRANGAVWAVGNNRSGQCDVSLWNHIVAISAGEYYSVGLKSDGTVVAVGENENGQCNVTEWKDIKVPNN